MATATKEMSCSVTEGFGQWLSESGGTLLVASRQRDKVGLMCYRDGDVVLVLRHLDQPSAIAVDGRRVSVATSDRIVVFSNSSPLAKRFPEHEPAGHDGLFLPRLAHYTGQLDVSDLCYSGDTLWMVNTRFSCLAKTSSVYSFEPAWQPQFVTKLAPEDRCHLSGLALREGTPAFVTAFGESNRPEGWWDNRETGGIIIDVETDELVCDGLCMPHSPRWHDNRLWVLDSGKGNLCVVDSKTGRPEVVAELPGYARGLCFAGPFAIVGLWKTSRARVYRGLPVTERVENPQAGIAVVDIRSGETVAQFTFNEGCDEIDDVQFLPGFQQPMLLVEDDLPARQAISTKEFGYWLNDAKDS